MHICGDFLSRSKSISEEVSILKTSSAFFLRRQINKFIKTCLKIMNYEVRKERLQRNIMLNCLRRTVKNKLTKFHLVSPDHLVL